MKISDLIGHQLDHHDLKSSYSQSFQRESAFNGGNQRNQNE